MFRQFVLVGLLALGWLEVHGAVVVDYGSSWKYFVGTSEASSPDASAWRGVAFADAAWKEGKAPIGYANPPGNPTEESIATVLPTAQESPYLSVFCRKTFQVANPSAVGELVLNVNVDDGCIAWINGVEVGRYNVPDGVLGYNSTASSAIEPTIMQFHLQPTAGKPLVTGANVLAIQVFNANSSSSDLVIDAALSMDTDESPPSVVDVDPPAGTVVNELSTIEVVFNESVAHVDAADLLVNGAPALRVTQIAPNSYTFGFNQPAARTVTVSWAVGNGITDLATPPNSFVGSSWSYTLETNLPPAAVAISEFMADNQSGVRDDFGSRSDWIELYNSGTTAAKLGGWFLTDSTNQLAKWRMPDVFIPAKGYLLVWASGRNRTNTATPLHTSFKLEKNLGYLALISPATNIVSEFGPDYPAQRADVSYGRDATGTTVGFFQIPTPGAKNSTTGPGFAPTPVFSMAQGVYTNTSIPVSLSTSAGQIRYTLDGTPPSSTSTLYSGALTVTTTTTVKARVFQDGLLPGEVVAKNYVMVDGTVSGFSSTLPIIVVSTTGRAVADHVPSGQPRTFGSMLAVDTFRGRSSPLGEPDYFGQCEIGVRGQTSSGFPKRPYRLELQDAYRLDRKESLLGLPSESDWVLYNPYTDKPFLQNFLAFELFGKMGHYSVRTRFVELFLNTSGGKVAYPRDYAGVYLLMEKIEQGENRVNIEKLTPADKAEPEISGGYMFKKDKDSSGDLNFATSGGGGFSGQSLKIHEPKPDEITTQQLSWLRTYLNNFEKALYATTWKTATGTNHYSYYIDVDSFVDQHWMVEFAKQIDGYRLSNYMTKDRNGKVQMAPIWDYNLSFGNADYNGGDSTSGWYYSNLGDNDHIWLRRLITGTTSASTTSGDPDFNQRIVDRWSQLTTNVFNLTNILTRVDEMAALLSEPAARDFQKWPRLGVYVWPNSSIYVRPTTFAGIISSFKGWITGRHAWIDRQYPHAPVLARTGGRVPVGFPLAMTSDSGQIYYTLDGTDPRLPGGAISPTALLYTGPAVLTNTARVTARVRNVNKWSGPRTAILETEAPSLVISELMYHPAAPPAGSPYDTEEFEYIEFRNVGMKAFPLSGCRIVKGVEFTFPSWDLDPGGRVLVVRNRAAFESRYGAALPVVGEYTGSLDNGGERIVVQSPLGATVVDFEYHPGWYPQTDGAGFSLVPREGAGGVGQPGEAANWKVSAVEGGTPGRGDAGTPSIPPVLVNEVLSHPDLFRPDLIELRNPTASAVDLGGWFLSDDLASPKKYRIKAGTVVPAGGYFVLDGNEILTASAEPFGLSSLGDAIYLFSGGGATNLTGYVHGFEFGAQAEGVTFGRLVDSAGREQFVAQAASSIGAGNTGPRVPAVVISEVQYHPPDLQVNGFLWNDTESEFVELFNRSAQAVPLFDPKAATNTWRLGGAVEYEFPTNVTMAAGARILVVGFNPATKSDVVEDFREKYSVPATAQLYGPFKGHFDNRKGRVALYFPDTTIVTAGVSEPAAYVLAEEMIYDEGQHWPGGADGSGFSLQRRDPAAFGNDPANWVAARPTAGMADGAGATLTISRQPSGGTVLAGSTVSLSVAAAGTGPLRYQWRLNGANVAGATNSIQQLAAVRPEQGGRYEVVVANTETSVTSEAALVTVVADSDGDGLPDWWELARGTDAYDAADATLDSDGDGLTNRDEFLAGTDPLDPHSTLGVERVELGREVVITFRVAAARAYRVEYSDDLRPGSWQVLRELPAQDAASEARVTDAGSPAQRYYRIVALPGPISLSR